MKGQKTAGKAQGAGIAKQTSPKKVERGSGKKEKVDPKSKLSEIPSKVKVKTKSFNLGVQDKQ